MADGDRRSDRVVESQRGMSGEPFLGEFDMGLIRPLSRSVRLNGFSTCMRLEQVYWNILTSMAHDHCCSIGTLLSRVDREVHLRHGGVKNFSGLVRVVCVLHGLKDSAAASAQHCE